MTACGSTAWFIKEGVICIRHSSAHYWTWDDIGGLQRNFRVKNWAILSLFGLKLCWIW